MFSKQKDPLLKIKLIAINKNAKLQKKINLIAQLCIFFFDKENVKEKDFLFAVKQHDFRFLSSFYL